VHAIPKGFEILHLVSIDISAVTELLSYTCRYGTVFTQQTHQMVYNFKKVQRSSFFQISVPDLVRYFYIPDPDL